MKPDTQLNFMQLCVDFKTSSFFLLASKNQIDQLGRLV